MSSTKLQIKPFDLNVLCQRYPKFEDAKASGGYKFDPYGGRTIIAIGSRGSGKTTFIMQYLSTMAAHKQNIPFVLCFTPSDQYQHKFDVHIPAKDVHDDYKDELFDKFVRAQQQLKKIHSEKKDGADTRAVVIIDDCGPALKDISKSLPMKFILFNGRHIDTNLIISTQDVLGDIPPAIRSNFNYCFAFFVGDMNIERLYRNWAQTGTLKLFRSIYKTIIEQKCGMVIDLLKNTDDVTEKYYIYKPEYDLPKFKCSPGRWGKTAVKGSDIDAIDSPFNKKTIKIKDEY